jgi:hypothetical protein
MSALGGDLNRFAAFQRLNGLGGVLTDLASLTWPPEKGAIMRWDVLRRPVEIAVVSSHSQDKKNSAEAEF